MKFSYFIILIIEEIILIIEKLCQCLNEYNELSEEMKKTAKELTLGDIVKLKSTLLDLEKALDEAPFCLDIPSSGKTVSGAEVLRCFFSSGFTIDQFGRFVRILDGVSSFLASNYTEATGCDKFSGVLRVLSTRLLSGHPDLFLSSYAVRVEMETPKGSTGPQQDLTSWKKPKGKIFNFWCLNPAVGLDLLLQHNPRCIMLASGTLSPVDFLENELQLHFPIKIQNPHIITDKQLYAGILKVGPGDVKLSSSFNNRGKSEYIVSLGTVVREACEVVPQGVLVFFPSYSAMDQAVDFWKENGHWQAIGGEKSVYVEPRGKRALDDLIQNYYTDCQRAGGSCLMAVCRGKVSEGLDFTDGKCRAVIITGLPYAPFKNEQVTGKIKYLDGKANGTQGIKGMAWYSIDAVRALNQAVGRIIRHKEDYGAILLLDERCDYKDVRDNLSGWVSGRLVRPPWQEMLTGLKGFFRGYGVQSFGGGSRSYTGPSGYSPGNRAASQAGSSFEFNSQTRSYRVKLREEAAAIEETPEVKFAELYDGGDFAEEIKVTTKKKGSALDRLKEMGTVSPRNSFTTTCSGNSSSSGAIRGDDKTEKSEKDGGFKGNGNPKKKIKLVGENKEPTRYSRLIPQERANPRLAGLTRCGETVNHLLTNAQRREMEEKKKIFAPIFTSTQSPVKKQEAGKLFDNVKEYGEWVG